MQVFKKLLENDKVLNFIERRFQKDCNWTTGNCYYFALILKDRFPKGEIFYDVIDGHFLFDYKNVKYDWKGILSNSGKHYYVKWSEFDEYDAIQKEKIIKDCIM